MAKGNLAACLAVTLPHEGKYSDHPADPGGATNMGITHKVLAAWRGVGSVTKAEVKALTLIEATAIYAERYWAPVRGEVLPFGIDLSVFDYGVNSGINRAGKELQRVVGAKVDGQIGHETIKATVLADAPKIIKAISARRLSFMQSLKIWETFKRGWSRRVADVEAKAMAMWLGRGAALSPAQRDELLREGDAAASKARTQDKAAGAGAVTGTGATGLEVASDPNWLLVGGIVVAVLVIGGLLMVHARKNSERAAAYKAVAGTV